MLTAVIFALVLAVPEVRAQSPKPPIAAGVEAVLWWLPPDTETVQVTQTPAQPQGPLFEVMRHARGEFQGGSTSWANTLRQHLDGVRIEATVEGSRRFAPPTGLGGMLYEGALIIRFARPLGETGKRLMADLQQSALKADQFDGLSVLEFRDKLEQDVWTSYVTMPRADVLVVATNRAYLEELLRRRNGRTGKRALPEELPEWQWIDVSAPFWTLRHYRRDAQKDPTSPFSESNMVGGRDPEALGVTAHVNADGRTVVAHYVSRAASAEQTARRIWHHPGERVEPEFRRVGTNAVEVRLVAATDEHLSTFFFFLIAAIGHAIYL